MDIQKEREAFDQYFKEKYQEFHNEVFDENGDDRAIIGYSFAWSAWQATKAQAVPEGFVLVEKSKTEHWYLDEGEGLYMDDPGYWLCDLDIGEVQAVEHKEYLVTESNTLYATKVWDDKNKDVDSWQFFTSKDEAEKAAAHCKAKFWEEEAQEQVG